MKLNFLDIIENGYASENNPTRVGYVIRVEKRTGKLNPGEHVELTDGKGRFWELSLSNDKIRILGDDLWPEQRKCDLSQFKEPLYGSGK